MRARDLRGPGRLRGWALAVLAALLIAWTPGPPAWVDLSTPPFNGLTKLALEQIPAAGPVPDLKVSVSYAAEHTTILRKPAADGVRELILSTRLRAEDPKTVTLVYDPGPSADPGFELYDDPTLARDPLLSVSGESIWIPGNGAVYVAGHANQLFEVRRKFEWRDGALVEVPQPLLLVGVKTTVQRVPGQEEPARVVLWADKERSAQVAVLPEGSPIEVLVCEPTPGMVIWCLARSGFGLVGWVSTEATMPDGVDWSMPVTEFGVYFAGD